MHDASSLVAQRILILSKIMTIACCSDSRRYRKSGGTVLNTIGFPPACLRLRPYRPTHPYPSRTTPSCIGSRMRSNCDGMHDKIMARSSADVHQYGSCAICEMRFDWWMDLSDVRWRSCGYINITRNLLSTSLGSHWR